MVEFLNCVLYLAAAGLGLFLAGRIVPKTFFRADRFPFQSFQFEADGRIYETIQVRKWKDGFPDMSVILPSLIPSKRLPKALTSEQVISMIQETCIAEWVHALLCLLGFGCVFLWEGINGWLISLLYALGNLPYIIIQRYNRPKLIRILKKLQIKEAGCTNRRQEKTHGEGAFIELQYGSRP